jgi:hypothetical protein
MTHHLSALLASVDMYERLRNAQNDRHRRVHTYAMPLVREIARPAEPDALDTCCW